MSANNLVMLMGRLTKDPEIRYSQGANSMAFGSFSLAVDRKFKKDGEPTADFPNCKVFGKTAEFTERYIRKGTKVLLRGHLQTGSYTNKDGVKVYTTDVIVDELDFAESKGSGESKDYKAPTSATAKPSPSNSGTDGFMNIPDGIDEELPFN